MSFASQVLLLVRVGLRSEMRRFGRMRLLPRLAVLIGVSLAIVVLGSFSAAIAAAVSTLPRSQAAVLEAGVLAGGFTAATIVLLVAALPLGLTTLSGTSEMPLLLATPVSPRAVFTQRLIVAALWESILAFAILAPLMAGIGIAAGAGPVYVVAAIVLLLLAPLLPLSVGQLLVFGLLRFVSARTVRTVIGLLGALMGAGWYLGRIGPTRQFALSAADNLAALGSAPIWSNPAALPGRALSALLIGDGFGFVLPAAAFAVLAIGAFAGSVALAAAVTTNGWFDVANGGPRRRGRRDTSWDNAAGGWLPGPAGPIRAIIVKDWRSIVRDPLTWTRLLAPLAAFGFIVYQLLAFAARFSGPNASLFRSAAVIAALGFLAWNLNNRLALSVFNRERQAIVWLIASPVSIRQVVSGKLLAALVPQLVLLVPAAVALAIFEGANARETALIVFGAPFLIVTLAAVTVGIAAYFPKFNFENVQRVNTVPAILLSSLLQLLILVVYVAVLIGLPALASTVDGAYELPAVVLSLLLAAAGMVAACAFAVVDGARRVNRWELSS